jgi:hypothetical protein
MIKSKRSKLTGKLTKELESESPSVDNIIKIFESFENNDAKTLEKLKREKKVEMNKIHGALRQTINAHGPITKEFIGSAGKRIYGSLLANPNSKPENECKKISVRDILIGVIITTIIFLLI